MKERTDIPITIDFHDDYNTIIGGIFAPQSDTLGLQIYKMLEHGYSFELSPAIQVHKVDENGNITEAELLGVSIITHTARKHHQYEPDTDVVLFDDYIANKGVDKNEEE